MKCLLFLHGQALMHKLLVYLFFIALFLFPSQIFASENSYITIVNPQRISSYTKNYLASFQAEKYEIESRNLPATWLLTYNVLTKNDFVKELKTLNRNQELGIFLEITPELSKKANVAYNSTSSWHYATSLFLSGYSQNDRKKLIDTVFETFKNTFGYYPVSVGGWWVDSYSLEYMKKKYNIISVLGVSDQYDLDHYTVWGTWWSVPYYPNKTHAAIPAQNTNEKLDIVSLRWAARDPLHGYHSPSSNAASMYSVQDYSTLQIDSSYFEKLLSTFSLKHYENSFGHITVGLEGDLDPSIYKTNFAKQLDIVKQFAQTNNTKLLTMGEFSKWYRSSFPSVSPNHLVYAQDLLGRGDKQSLWMQTPYYRIGILYDSKKKTLQIVDLREYYPNFKEPFFSEKNMQNNLPITLPYLIDTEINPGTQEHFNLGELLKATNKSLVFEKGIVQFNDNSITFPTKTFTFGKKYSVPNTGIVYKDASITFPFTLKRRFPYLPGTIPFIIPQSFYISQSEYDALQVLKKQKMGNVLAFDKDCIKCAFTSQYKPAAAAGKKSYINVFTNKPVQIDISFLLARSSVNAKNILKEKNIRYIYLSKYESYVESLPYLPQDLGLKRVYQNANAEIWKVD